MPTGRHPAPGPLSQKVAETLSREISRRGLRQIDVAASAGMSASQLSRALSATKVFTLDQLSAVCDAIGMSLSDLIRMTDEAQRFTRGGAAEAGVRPLRQDERAVAKRKGRDRGGDDGDG